MYPLTCTEDPGHGAVQYDHGHLGVLADEVVDLAHALHQLVAQRVAVARAVEAVQHHAAVRARQPLVLDGTHILRLLMYLSGQ